MIFVYMGMVCWTSKSGAPLNVPKRRTILSPWLFASSAARDKRSWSDCGAVKRVTKFWKMSVELKRPESSRAALSRSRREARAALIRVVVARRLASCVGRKESFMRSGIDSGSMRAYSVVGMSNVLPRRWIVSVTWVENPAHLPTFFQPVSFLRGMFPHPACAIARTTLQNQWYCSFRSLYSGETVGI